MSLLGEQVLLRIYLHSADRAPHAPTYERIVKAARSAGLAGCTVLKGILGYGSHGTTAQSLWSISEDVPVIVEIVDSAQKVQAFIHEILAQLMPGGMLTLERANVMMYRENPTPPHSAAPRRISPLGELLAQPLSTIPKIQPEPNMTITENGVLLRIFAGESDKADGKPLHEAILQQARQLGLSGATVLRGVEGFGANSIVHRANLLEMSTDLPIVIEIVDTDEKIKLLLPYLEHVVQEGMITMEHVAIVFYRHNPADAQST